MSTTYDLRPLDIDPATGKALADGKDACLCDWCRAPVCAAEIAPPGDYFMRFGGDALRPIIVCRRCAKIARKRGIAGLMKLAEDTAAEAKAEAERAQKFLDGIRPRLDLAGSVRMAAREAQPA